MKADDQPPYSTLPTIAVAKDAYEAWASANGKYSQFPAFHKLDDKDIERWEIFAQNWYANHPPLVEPSPPADVQKFGEFTGDLIDVMWVNAERSVDYAPKRGIPTYAQWRTDKLKANKNPVWAFWRKAPEPLHDYQVDYVAYMEWVSGQEDKLHEADLKAYAAAQAQLGGPPHLKDQ